MKKHLILSLSLLCTPGLFAVSPDDVKCAVKRLVETRERCGCGGVKPRPNNNRMETLEEVKSCCSSSCSSSCSCGCQNSSTNSCHCRQETEPVKEEVVNAVETNDSKCGCSGAKPKPSRTEEEVKEVVDEQSKCGCGGAKPKPQVRTQYEDAKKTVKSLLETNNVTTNVVASQDYLSADCVARLMKWAKLNTDTENVTVSEELKTALVEFDKALAAWFKSDEYKDLVAAKLNLQEVVASYLAENNNTLESLADMLSEFDETTQKLVKNCCNQ